MRSSLRSVTLALGCGLLAASVPAQQQQPLVLKFGAYSYKKPTDVYKEFEPVLQVLQPAVARAVGRPAQIELKITKTYEECLEAFVRGEVDFVRFGPASYVLAKKRAPDVKLLAVEEEDGKKICKGYVVVRADSKIKSLEDLAGKRFAFGDEQSTIGRFLSQAVLFEAGITAKKLQGFEYLDRHDRVFDAVESGEFDAGALHESVFAKRNKKKVLRVLWPFDNAGKPWIARAGLDGDIVEALSTALTSMTDEAALAALKVTALTRGRDSDFEGVRKGMAESEKFDDRPVQTPAKPDKD